MDDLRLFQSIGLSEAKAKETAKNSALSKNLTWIITEATTLCSGHISKQIGVLLYHVATRFKGSQDNTKLLLSYVCTEKIVSELQLNAAFDFLKRYPLDINVTEFETSCGVGVVVTTKDIEDEVTKVINAHKIEILEKRYKCNIGSIIGSVRASLKWADGKILKSEVDKQLELLLGPRTAEANAPKSAEAKAPKQKKAAAKPTNDTVEEEESSVKLIGAACNFHKPGMNHLTKNYVVTPKTMELLKKHLEETGGRVITRFPPEPNGILHIGHAKAINFNFGYAKAHDGITYLRYDDTNPEKEEEKFFVGIREMVEWLGFKPYAVKFSSDYFPLLYKHAVELIKRGHAYVCHQQYEEIKGHNPPPSPWRDRPIEESLRLFEDMSKGKIDEGMATLRMKLTMEDSKQDPVAYRIKFTPHPNSKDQWCIYPTYDYTHCLCDSIENISHSLCTKEFQARRSSYYWLCNCLDLYCPVQWEYGRMNLSYTVVSKRKIAKLIAAGIVDDWDDPRLYTLTALRRRGFPPEAINKFCAKAGVTMAQTMLHPDLLDSCVRDVLNQTARRIMAVLEPLKVVITNFMSESPIMLEVPNIPHDPGQGVHRVPFDRIIYIEQSDFKKEADSQYRRLTVKQSVGLRHTGYVITVTDVIKDSSGNIQELHATCEESKKVAKPKAFIHWVSNPVKCEVRIYDRLFEHEFPEQVPGGFLCDCRKDSLTVINDAMVDRSIEGNSKPLTKFQFERIGYFCVDTNSANAKMIFNKTMGLKEDAGK
ncbi:glutamine--tRNA ligase-like [Dysidea avara]|uniref:glutamine--tRNA ligase-like n=1 Tax=Dysidea avara TaxID=196820 RepID=UPI00332D6065